MKTFHWGRELCKRTGYITICTDGEESSASTHPLGAGISKHSQIACKSLKSEKQDTKEMDHKRSVLHSNEN